MANTPAGNDILIGVQLQGAADVEKQIQKLYSAAKEFENLAKGAQQAFTASINEATHNLPARQKANVLSGVAAAAKQTQVELHISKFSIDSAGTESFNRDVIAKLATTPIKLDNVTISTDGVNKLANSISKKLNERSILTNTVIGISPWAAEQSANQIADAINKRLSGKIGSAVGGGGAATVIGGGADFTAMKTSLNNIETILSGMYNIMKGGGGGPMTPSTPPTSPLPGGPSGQRVPAFGQQSPLYRGLGADAANRQRQFMAQMAEQSAAAAALRGAKPTYSVENPPPGGWRNSAQLREKLIRDQQRRDAEEKASRRKPARNVDVSTYDEVAELRRYADRFQEMRAVAASKGQDTKYFDQVISNIMGGARGIGQHESRRQRTDLAFGSGRAVPPRRTKATEQGFSLNALQEVQQATGMGLNPIEARRLNMERLERSADTAVAIGRMMGQGQSGRLRIGEGRLPIWTEKEAPTKMKFFKGAEAELKAGIMQMLFKNPELYAKFSEKQYKGAGGESIDFDQKIAILAQRLLAGQMGGQFSTPQRSSKAIFEEKFKTLRELNFGGKEMTDQDEAELYKMARASTASEIRKQRSTARAKIPEATSFILGEIEKGGSSEQIYKGLEKAFHTLNREQTETRKFENRALEAVRGSGRHAEIMRQYRAGTGAAGGAIMGPQWEASISGALSTMDPARRSLFPKKFDMLGNTINLFYSRLYGTLEHDTKYLKAVAKGDFVAAGKRVERAAHTAADASVSFMDSLTGVLEKSLSPQKLTELGFTTKGGGAKRIASRMLNAAMAGGRGADIFGKDPVTGEAGEFLKFAQRYRGKGDVRGLEDVMRGVVNELVNEQLGKSLRKDLGRERREYGTRVSNIEFGGRLYAQKDIVEAAGLSPSDVKRKLGGPSGILSSQVGSTTLFTQGPLAKAIEFMSNGLGKLGRVIALTASLSGAPGTTKFEESLGTGVTQSGGPGRKSWSVAQLLNRFRARKRGESNREMNALLGQVTGDVDPSVLAAVPATMGPAVKGPNLITAISAKIYDSIAAPLLTLKERLGLAGGAGAAGRAVAGATTMPAFDAAGILPYRGRQQTIAGFDIDLGNVIEKLSPKQLAGFDAKEVRGKVEAEAKKLADEVGKAWDSAKPGARIEAALLKMQHEEVKAYEGIRPVLENQLRLKDLDNLRTEQLTLQARQSGVILFTENAITAAEEKRAAAARELQTASTAYNAANKEYMSIKKSDRDAKTPDAEKARATRDAAEKELMLKRAAHKEVMQSTKVEMDGLKAVSRESEKGYRLVSENLGRINRAQERFDTLQKTLGPKFMEKLGDPRGQKSITQLETALKRLSTMDDRVMEKIINTNKRVEASFGRVLSRVIKWGSAATIVYQLQASLRMMLTTIAETESGFLELQKVSEPLFFNMRETISGTVEIARQFGVTIGQAQESLKLFLQQGFNMKESMNLASAALMAANISTIDVNGAAEALTATLIQFKKPASEAGDIISSWSNVADTTAVDIQHMADAIKKAGSVATVAGVNFDNLNGLIAVVGSATRKSGAEIGTSMRLILKNFQDPKAVKVLEDMGIHTRTLTNAQRGFMDILSDVNDKWGQWDNEQKKRLAVALGEQRFWNDFMVLMNNYSGVLDAAKTSANAFGVAQSKNALIMSSWTKKTADLKLAIQEFYMSMGQSGGLGALKTLTGIGSAVARAAAGFPNILKTIVVGGAAAAAAVMYLGRAVSFLTGEEFTLFQRASANHQLNAARAAATKLNINLMGMEAEQVALVAKNLGLQETALMNLVGAEKARVFNEEARNKSNASLIGAGKITRGFANRAVGVGMGLSLALGTAVAATAPKIGEEASGLNKILTTTTTAIGGLTGAAMAFVSLPPGINAVAAAFIVVATAIGVVTQKMNDAKAASAANVKGIEDRLRRANQEMMALKNLSREYSILLFGKKENERTADDMRKMTEYSNKIAELLPDMRSGFDAAGNSILIATNNQKEFNDQIKFGVDKLAETQEIQAKLLSLEYLTGRKSAFEQVKASSDAQKAIKSILEFKKDDLAKISFEPKTTQQLANTRIGVTGVIDELRTRVFKEQGISEAKGLTKPVRDVAFKRMKEYQVWLANVEAFMNELTRGQLQLQASGIKLLQADLSSGRARNTIGNPEDAKKTWQELSMLTSGDIETAVPKMITSAFKSAVTKVDFEAIRQEYDKQGLGEAFVLSLPKSLQDAFRSKKGQISDSAQASFAFIANEIGKDENWQILENRLGDVSKGFGDLTQIITTDIYGESEERFIRFGDRWADLAKMSTAKTADDIVKSYVSLRNVIKREGRVTVDVIGPQVMAPSKAADIKDTGGRTTKQDPFTEYISNLIKNDQRIVRLYRDNLSKAKAEFDKFSTNPTVIGNLGKSLEGALALNNALGGTFSGSALIDAKMESFTKIKNHRKRSDAMGAWIGGVINKPIQDIATTISISDLEKIRKVYEEEFAGTEELAKSKESALNKKKAISKEEKSERVKDINETRSEAARMELNLKRIRGLITQLANLKDAGAKLAAAVSPMVLGIVMKTLGESGEGISRLSYRGHELNMTLSETMKLLSSSGGVIDSMSGLANAIGDVSTTVAGLKLGNVFAQFSATQSAGAPVGMTVLDRLMNGQTLGESVKDISPESAIYKQVTGLIGQNSLLAKATKDAFEKLAPNDYKEVFAKLFEESAQYAQTKIGAITAVFTTITDVVGNFAEGKDQYGNPIVTGSSARQFINNTVAKQFREFANFKYDQKVLSPMTDAFNNAFKKVDLYSSLSDPFDVMNQKMEAFLEMMNQLSQDSEKTEEVLRRYGVDLQDAQKFAVNLKKNLVDLNILKDLATSGAIDPTKMEFQFKQRQREIARTKEIGGILKSMATPEEKMMQSIMQAGKDMQDSGALVSEGLMLYMDQNSPLVTQLGLTTDALNELNGTLPISSIPMSGGLPDFSNDSAGYDRYMQAQYVRERMNQLQKRVAERQAASASATVEDMSGDNNIINQAEYTREQKEAFRKQRDAEKERFKKFTDTNRVYERLTAELDLTGFENENQSSFYRTLVGERRYGTSIGRSFGSASRMEGSYGDQLAAALSKVKEEVEGTIQAAEDGLINGSEEVRRSAKDVMDSALEWRKTVSAMSNMAEIIKGLTSSVSSALADFGYASGAARFDELNQRRQADFDVTEKTYSLDQARAQLAKATTEDERKTANEGIRRAQFELDQEIKKRDKIKPALEVTARNTVSGIGDTMKGILNQQTATGFANLLQLDEKDPVKRFLKEADNIGRKMADGFKKEVGAGPGAGAGGSAYDRAASNMLPAGAAGEGKKKEFFLGSEALDKAFSSELARSIANTIGSLGAYGGALTGHPVGGPMAQGGASMGTAAGSIIGNMLLPGVGGTIGAAGGGLIGGVIGSLFDKLEEMPDVLRDLNDEASRLDNTFKRINEEQTNYQVAISVEAKFLDASQLTPQQMRRLAGAISDEVRTINKKTGSSR